MYIDNQILFRLDESFKDEAPPTKKNVLLKDKTVIILCQFLNTIREVGRIRLNYLYKNMQQFKITMHQYKNQNHNVQTIITKTAIGLF